MKVLILDSGTLINLSMNGLLYILEPLKKQLNGKLIITTEVKYEVLDRPIKVPRFELGALRIKSLLDSGVLELPPSINISEKEVSEETTKLLNIANHSLQEKRNWIKIVSQGEISCLALSTILSEKGIENLIAIDERTTRMLAEKPENLEKIMERKLHKRVKIVLSPKDFKIFSKFRFIRSSELVYVASKLNLLALSDPKALEAGLYATKYHGAAISFEEINILKKM